MSDSPRERDELERLEEQLRPHLDQQDVPAARPEFRAALGESFRSASPEGSADAGADSGADSRADEETGGGPLEEILAAELQRFGSVAPARAEFRESLRGSFLSAGEGTPQRSDQPQRRKPAERRHPDGRAPSGHRSPSGRRTRSPRPAPRRRRSPWPLALGGVLAAAAAIALLVLSGVLGPSAPAAPTWRVDAIEGSLAEVFLDGRPLDGLPADELAARLAAGGRVHTTRARARLVLERTLLVELGPDSRIGLPAPTGEGPLAIAGEQGHLLFATGPDFRPGEGLRVQTSEAEVEVVGTIFAVDLYGEGTCVCCEEGEVLVRSLRTRQDQRVAQHGLGFVDADDGELHVRTISPDHQAPLLALEGALPDVW